MEFSRSRKILFLRIGYWAGIALDALAFVQMAFPGLDRRMLGVSGEFGPD